MDNVAFQKKLLQWLKETDSLPNAIWTLTESQEPETVVITVYIKEFLFNEKQILLTRELTGSSITKKSDETIQTAVLALNEELINRIQHDYI